MKYENALNDGFTLPVRDALHGHVYMTEALEALTRSAPFMRLYRIAQLGPAALVYPGATHTRAAHSIGVYHITRRLLSNLAGRGADEWLTPSGIKSMLCAAMLHDIGHFPYAHSLKELPLASHEELGASLIASEPLRGMVGGAGADPDLCASIVDPDRSASGQEPLFLRKLLSGCLDPDKLDYLNRDALFSGVPYGAPDVDFILSVLYPHPERGIEIDSRGIAGVESVLFSKYLMYRSVYWHHSVRSATAMMKKAVSAGLKDGTLMPEELYCTDDNGLFALLEPSKNPAFSLAGMIREGRLYATAARTAFDEKHHAGLENFEYRNRLEERLAARLSRESGRVIPELSVIIDVPERTVFETNLFVRDEDLVFGESSSFFKAEAVAGFVRTLRIVRLFIERDILRSIGFDADRIGGIFNEACFGVLAE